MYSKNIKLLWLPAEQGTYRAAVVVSKKVHKSAVVRNRIRRRLYEITRNALKGHEKAPDLIYIVQNPVLATQSTADVQAEVLDLLKKIPNML